METLIALLKWRQIGLVRFVEMQHVRNEMQCLQTAEASVDLWPVPAHYFMINICKLFACKYFEPL
jgi:hypothetical protein